MQLNFSIYALLGVPLEGEARNYYTYSGKFCYAKLTFKSLNDKLADTGYSIANYVQLALPGT